MDVSSTINWCAPSCFIGSTILPFSQPLLSFLLYFSRHAATGSLYSIMSFICYHRYDNKWILRRLLVEYHQVIVKETQICSSILFRFSVSCLRFSSCRSSCSVAMLIAFCHFSVSSNCAFWRSSVCCNSTWKTSIFRLVSILIKTLLHYNCLQISAVTGTTVQYMPLLYGGRTDRSVIVINNRIPEKLLVTALITVPISKTLKEFSCITILETYACTTLGNVTNNKHHLTLSH